MKLSIVIPVRNEEIVIKKIIDQLEYELKNLPYEIIFIDDFSTDNTAKVTKELIKDKPQINIYGNERKGLGGAITQGIFNANGEVVCIMMSDLSDNIDDLEKYYKPGEFNEGRKKMAKIPEGASLIYNPSSGAPGFIVDNVYCLPGVPSILKSMLGGLNNKIIGGKKILSKTINLETVESEISLSLEKVQNKFKNAEIGSYPFFKQGKIGVSIVIRSTEKNLIKKCRNEIKNFIKKKILKLLKGNNLNALFCVW